MQEDERPDDLLEKMLRKGPIRVLIVAATLPIVGGQTVQAERLRQRLNLEPNVVVEIQSVNPVFLPRLQRIKYIRTAITSARYLAELMMRIPAFDVIHVFSASYTSFVLSPTPALLVSLLFSKPTILNYHSGEAEDHLSRWKRTAVPTMRMFDRIVVPSKYLVEVFERFGLHAEAIFNFIETERFKFRERNFQCPVLLSNRNFETHYGVDNTLRAFRIIQNAIPGARMIVVGDGPQREQLLNLAKELCLTNIEFRGAVNPDKMPGIYDEADIFLNSSIIDNMPLSILEAFSSGLPVVTTGAGGIPFIVEDRKTALVIGVNDPNELATSALELIRDQQLARDLAHRARNEVNRYRWAEVKKRWLAVYEELTR